MNQWSQHWFLNKFVDEWKTIILESVDRNTCDSFKAAGYVHGTNIMQRLIQAPWCFNKYGMTEILKQNFEIVKLC